MAAAQNPDMIQGAWLLLLESDYAWMKPLEVGTVGTAVPGGGKGAAGAETRAADFQSCFFLGPTVDV